MDKYLRDLAEKLFNTHSPTGYSNDVNKLLVTELTSLGYEPTISNKGNVFIKVKGNSSEITRATSAHVDTLGLMVRSINSNGTLKVTNIGGPIIPTLDGEYCVIKTRDNKEYTGTILCTSNATHVYSDASSKVRNVDNMEVRLDVEVKNKQDVLNLGINNGDYVCYDPKFTIVNDFIKSRFIDDKGGVLCLFSILKEISISICNPLAYDTYFYFVNHEEVGHGATTISDEIDEFVTIDMGCVGLDLAGNEYSVSICAKDSSGPYDYNLTTKLINISKDNQIDYVVDIFPYYGSDVSAALRSGKDIKGALIGPGVAASHGMERTHVKAIENTIKLMNTYLSSK
ncbi:MAG: M42 family metallopeptidase [bacterium]